MQLYVVRHGQTDYNLENRYAGSTDVPLSAVGLQQAEQLALRLRGTPMDILVCSPLLRARQTAAAVQAATGLPLVLAEAFAERNLGLYEGRTRAQIQAELPALWARNLLHQADDAPPGGESVRQFDARVTAGLEALHAAYAGQRVLLICHGYVSRLIHRYYHGLTYQEMNRFLLDNCEVAVYGAQAERL